MAMLHLIFRQYDFYIEAKLVILVLNQKQKQKLTTTTKITTQLCSKSGEKNNSCGGRI